MANPHNVELEAAKFLHKLIQDSKDEPTKLATKLYVILQHMRSSGKENSMPYQVISRAMETVIKQHGLDIEALMSSRLPLASGAQVGESGSPQVAGSSQRTGVTKDTKASLAGNEMSKPDSYPSSISHVGPNSGGHDAYQGSPSNMTGGAGKVHGMTPAAASSYPPVETGVSMPMQFASSSYDTHGYSGKMHKEGMEAFSAAPPSMDPYAGKNIAGRALDHEGGANVLPNANKLNQAGIPSNVPETSMLRSAALRDTGKAPVTQAPVSGLPFKEHHLKQLRAQCLVFLAFRNGLLPKKLHLDIALGNFFPKEEGPRREMIDQKGKEQSVHEPNNFPEASRPSAGHDNMRGIDRLPSGAPASGIYSEGNISKEADNNTSMKEDKSSHHAMPYEHTEERRLHLALRRKPETEMPKQETSESLSSSIRGMKYDSNTRNIPVGSREDDSGNNHQQPVIPHPASFVSGTIKHLKPEASNWPGNGYQNEACRVSAPASGLTHESQHRKENAASQSQNPADGYSLGHRHTGSNLPSLPLREQWKPISGIDGNVPLMPTKDSDVLVKHVLPVQEPDMQDEHISLATDRPSSPKYTTSEKWILDRQKRKFLTEKMWALKQQKTEQKKIAVCSAKLKENVISSEDINAKTKSVIELKKLKLLDLQRRLRSDILSDFLKPIASEMDRLKSIKKHRIGRRSKQLERYEQKMKEERQKRIRERQKEFFSEVEVHRERLEDAFKMKRERWKGFNKYVREFHKRKERIHREKIDRIQREKINLLKINDVEGYLRMVQDAKSDRVKQLLKETEKYLQKLGSKLQEAKTVAKRFETDMDDSRTSTTIEKNEFSYENEDETDQAKHYLESNEKYYLMAHSVKETVLDQPTMLLGGKLREYQMNGLRWLVSLYNNHLNGILADEMGLGKTVQVISLLCYLMETKNDRGPFLVVVPSSVLPGWESEINFWAPGMQKIIYSGPPDERRRLFKEKIVHQKFNVLLTTYEYLMNKHDRPKLSKVQWHYIIIDEGHRIKNASCKLNAELKHYRSNHRLLLTGTPLQNNLEELWALLNFLLPNIFNSSEDFSQWFNKPFESNGDNSPDEALLSEEENLLIINRLHQVLRPFVLRRLKHKVENQLPEKIERLIRCEASAYQKLLMKRVEENLGAIGSSKARSVHNSVMELRNICNHPYLSQLHVEEVHEWIPNHYLPNLIRLCGKLEMLDRLLPKLKATDHRVLLFSTMTRLLDVMEDYLCWKQYKYLRLDGHTSGGDRGALIDRFNQPGSPFFIFLLSIRAGGVGVNLQAADTVIIFDTDWNPQVDLQAQARAHRIGQKRDVLVLRLETVQTVEEQVRASAEHKLGVANQSITAGFFDNNTSAEDRREYLESLLRESKKEEAAPVLDDDALNDIIARSEPEIDIFESVDKKRREEEMGAWMKLVKGNGSGDSECLPPLPSRLLMDDDLKAFYEAMKIYETPQQVVASNGGMKRKGDYLGGLDTRQYGRGKRAREIRSYEEQLTEEEFEKLCQVDSPESPQGKEEITEKKLSTVMCDLAVLTGETPQVQVPQQPPQVQVPQQPPQVQVPQQPPQVQVPQQPPNPPVERAILHSKEVTPPSKRGRGRPRRAPTTTELSPSPGVLQLSSGAEQMIAVPKVENVSLSQVVPVPDSLPSSTPRSSISGTVQQVGIGIVSGTQSASLPPVVPAFQPTTLPGPSMPVRGRGRGRKAQSRGEAPRRRGKRQTTAVVEAPPTPTGIGNLELETTGEAASNYLRVCNPDPVSQPSNVIETTDEPNPISPIPLVSSSATSKSDLGSQEVPVPNPLPAPDAVSGCLVTAGVSNHSITPAPAPFPGSLVAAGVTQDPIVMSASCPDPVPNPSFPSIISDSQSAALAHPAPKQGRGRGRKAQTGGEAPRRRGKRQNPEAPSSFEVSTDQDPKSVEVPEKKPRVSVGRRPTRRNKQEHDVLKQVNVLQSVASQGIADSSTGQVCDNGPIDEAGKRTNVTLLDASKNRVDSVIVSVLFEDKQDNESQIPTNSVQAGASQSAGAPTMVQVNKDHEGKEDECQAVSIQSNPSQDINSLPVGQICDGKLENEAQKQMNIFNSGSSKVLADSPTLEGSKAERDDEVQIPKELVQLDPSLVITDSSVENITENQQEKEAQKQMIIVQSDTSPTTLNTAPTQANEVEQENEAPKPVCGARSYASQSIADPSGVQREVSEAEHQTDSGETADPSGVQREVSEAEHQTDSGETDAPQRVLDSSVVDANKDVQENNAHVLSNDVESDTPQNISDPSVGVARDVDHKSEAQKESDVQSDAAAVSSGPIPEVEDADNRESDAHILNNVLESGTPQNFRDFSVVEVREVDLESEAQKKGDVRSDVTIVISGFPEVEEADNKETDANILNDVMESGTPQNIADPLVGVILHVDPKSEAREETAVQSDVTAAISASVPKVENADNKESDAHILNDVVESGAPQNIADPLVGVIREVNLESEAQKETEVESDATAVISGLLLKDEDANNGGSNAHVLNDIMELGTPQNITDHSVGGVWHVDRESEAQKEAEVQLDATAVLSGSVPEVEDADNKESDAYILNDVVESGMPQNITDPSVGEAHDVDQENESQEETDVHSDMHAKSGSVAVFDADDKGSDADVLNDVMESDAPKNIAEPSVGEIRDVDLEIEAQNETDIQSDTPYDIGDPSAGEFRDVDQKIESQKETDVQSDRTAIISGSDPIVELADGNCRSEPREEGGAGLGEVQISSGGIHSTLSTSVTSGSDILHGGADDHVRNKEPFPEVGCDSIPPSEENASGALDVTLRNIDHFSIEQDPVEEESKEAAVSDFLASKPQLKENSHSALANVEPVTTVSNSSFCAPVNESGEEHTERNCIVDDAVVSDLGLTEKRNISEKCGDDSVLPLSSNSSILSPNDQSNEREVLAAVSSFVSLVSIVETEVSENLTGEDGSKEVEQKDYTFHGSQSSELLDEGAGAPDSELLEERSDSHCDKTDAEDHEKNENVSSQDSMSVLCTDENLASVPDHAPYELVDLQQKGDANCLESKATGLDEVLVLKHELTVSQTSKEMSSATLITVEQMAQQLDTIVNETGIQAVEEHANQQENVDPFVEEPLVRKLEVTDANVTSGKADEDELKNKNDLFSTHGSADSQSLGEITSLTCSALKIEALIAVPPNEECQNQVDNGFQMGEVGLASKVNQAVVSAPDNCETVTKSTSAVLDVVAAPQQYVEEKASSPLEILIINVAHDGAKEESVELNDDIVSKVIENRNDKLVSNAEATSQSFKVLEESTVLNAEMNETRSSSNDGESNNEGDLLLVEGSPLMDVNKEVAVSAVQTLSLKDALPDMAEVGCDSGGDESEKLESRDNILEKDSLAREEITSARNLVETTLSSNLVFKTENRNMEMVPNAEVVDGNAPNSNVSPVLVNEFCDNETNCVANLPETMDDSRKSIAEEASSSLEIASLDVTPAEVSVEKSEIGPCIDFVVDVQRSKEVELGKTVAADSEIHEPQPSVNAGTSQPKNGLQQLVEQYSETATDVEVSVTDSLTVDLRSSSQSSVDDSLKACQIQDSSALPARVEECSCPAENEENMQQQ